MNVQCGLLQEFMLYKFELSRNTAEATKNICCAKVAVVSTVTRLFKKFCLGCKNLDD